MPSVYCLCGRKLKVAADQAGRSTTCPVCGAVVKVPRRKDRKPPAEPVAFIERTGQPPRRNDPIETEVSIGSHSGHPQGLRPKKPLTPFDIPWHDSLLLPLHQWWFIVRLSGMFSVALLLCRAAFAGELADPNPRMQGTPLGVGLLIGLPALACVAQFLSHVVTEGVNAAGKVRLWTGFSAADAAIALWRWTVLVAAGPVLFALFGLWYWMRCGAPNAVDRFVLFEAAVLGGGWLSFALLSARNDRRLLDALPWRVASAACRFGWEAVAFAIVSGAVFWGTALIVVGAVGLGRREHSIAAFLLYWTAFGFGMATSSAMLHRLGVRHAQLTFVPPPEPPEEPEKQQDSPSAALEPSAR